MRVLTCTAPAVRAGASVDCAMLRSERLGVFMDIILAPFRLLWSLLAGILNLTGRVVALIIGLVLLIIGVLLSVTGVLACLGIPLAIFGFMLMIRGLF